MKRIAIIILNYCTPQLVINCLESLIDQLDAADHVVVVDSASPDNSAAVIEQEIASNGWQHAVTLVTAPANRGFAAGNNIGISTIAAEAYLLLNSDTLLRPHALDQLWQALSQNPAAGIISPRLEWPDGRPQISCFHNITPISELIAAARTSPVTRLLHAFDIPQPLHHRPATCEWTSFAAVLLRASLVAQLGLLDEGYFMYFEDVDYCRQARRGGWQILHWPAARVVHLRGGTSEVKAATAARQRRPGYYYAARARYFGKFYFGAFGVVFANLLWLGGRLIAWLRERFGRKQPHTCSREAQDIWINWRRPVLQG